MAGYAWPYPVAFYFNVKIGSMNVLKFSEVEGLEMSLQTEKEEEGGSQGYEFVKGVVHGDVTCTRLVTNSENDDLNAWLNQHFIGVTEVHPLPITISLLDADGNPTCAWFLTRAYPKKWTVEPFSSMNNELAKEKIVFAYHDIRRVM